MGLKLLINSLSIFITLILLPVQPMPVMLNQDFEGPFPNDGYEPGPSELPLLERIMRLLVPSAHAAFSLEECQNKFIQSKGYCTHFVAGKRPDACDWLKSKFHAYAWADEARKNGGEYGVTVSKTPQIGDIAVWSAYCEGTTAIPKSGQCTIGESGNYEGCGHVAFIISIDRQNSTFQVEEAAWNRSDPNVRINESCMDFIHKPNISLSNESISVISDLDQSKDIFFRNSDTIFLIDTSGSMGELDTSGVQKMTGAQHAALNLLDVIASEQQAGGGQVDHDVGLVEFSDLAYTYFSLINDIGTVQEAVGQLTPSGGTAMAAGLQEAIAQFESGGQAQRMIVLLSDGMPNIPLDFVEAFFNTAEEAEIRQEVIDLAQQAGEQGICVHTIGFGNPNESPESDSYIDEGFLREVAGASGCGQYYGAQESIQLANAFIELRHDALGEVIFRQSGTIQQGQRLDMGSIAVRPNQEQFMLTLNWPGSRLSPDLIDPRGMRVDASYPNATISEGASITTILIGQPSGGDWRLSILGEDVPQGITNYNALISTRGGLAPQQSETPTWLWIGLVALLFFIGVVATSPRPRAAVLTGPKGLAGHPLQQQPAAQPPPPNHDAHLAGMGGALAGKRVRIGRGGLLGRGPQCQLVIPDPAVSRAHARLFFSQGRWFIQDLHSRGGTWINQQRVEIAQLKDGDSIRIGKTTFTFHER